MSLYSFVALALRRFIRPVELPTEVRDVLIEAACRDDPQVLASLCLRPQDEIRRMFPIWRTVPEPLRNDPAARDRYCKGLVAIAAFFESAGDPSLLQLLMGDDGANPLILWERDLAREAIGAGALVYSFFRQVSCVPQVRVATVPGKRSVAIPIAGLAYPWFRSEYYFWAGFKGPRTR